MEEKRERRVCGELSPLLGKQSYICLLLHEGTYLEVKDASIVLYEGLVVRYDSTEQFFIQCQASNGSQEPAVTCKCAEAADNEGTEQLNQREKLRYREVAC